MFCCLGNSESAHTQVRSAQFWVMKMSIADNRVTDGDNAPFKDVEVELQTKEGKIFAHETAPPIFPKAVIGGSQGSLNSPYLCSTVGDKANSPDNNSSMPLP